MDMLKILNSTTFIDADPASDIEDKPTVSRTKAFGGAGAESKDEPKGKKGKKIKTRLVRNEVDDELSLEGIIEDKPGKKTVIKFLKARIEYYLNSDSDNE